MIVLFTDFGLAGPYTGQVLAVLQREAPGVPAISLFADAPAGAPKPSSYLLAAYAAWFPAGTVLLCVVDPGVGGERRALILEANGQFYVGPDNGLFEIVLRRATPAAQCREITWRPALLSASFHGRDLFAPVAARLARGEPSSAMARSAAPQRFADWPDDLAEIVYIDHYGNALTGMRGAAVAADGDPRLRHAKDSARPNFFGRAAGRGVLVRQFERARRDRRQRRPGRPVDRAVGREQGRGRGGLNTSPACARRGTAVRPG